MRRAQQKIKAKKNKKAKKAKKSKKKKGIFGNLF